MTGRNVKLFYFLESGLSLMGGIILPVYVLYFRHFDITLFQVALLAAVFEATIIVFEIPTGRFADRYGRRLSTIIGFGLYAVSALIFLKFRSLPGFLAAEIIFGIAETFISGALEALAVDSFPENERNECLPRLFSNRTTFKTAALLIGMLFGGWLAGKNLPMLFIPVLGVAILCLLAALFLIGKRPDRTGQTAGGKSSRVPFKTVFSGGMVTALFAVGLLSNFVYEPVDQFWQVLFSEVKTLGASYFGIITAAGMVLVVIFAGFSKRLYKWPGFYFSGAFILIGFSLFAASNLSIYPAAAGIIVYFALKELIRPLISTHLNRHFESANRATMLSAYNMVCSIGEVIAGVMAGILAQKYGILFVFKFSIFGVLAVIMTYLSISCIRPKN